MSIPGAMDDLAGTGCLNQRMIYFGALVVEKVWQDWALALLWVIVDD